MDKLIRVSKTKKVEEPLLDIEERRNNYDDRRAYTSYSEITREDDDNDFIEHDDLDSSLPTTSTESTHSLAAKDQSKHRTLNDRLLLNENSSMLHENSSMLHENSSMLNDSTSSLLIGNSDADSSGGVSRQRKRPILPPTTPISSPGAASASTEVNDATAALQSAGVRRDTRSARTVRTVRDVNMEDGDNGGTTLADNLRVKSSRTLQESIRESLTINNTSWNQDKRGTIGMPASTNHLIFETNEFYIEMLERLNQLKRGFDAHTSNQHVTDDALIENFRNWIKSDLKNTNIFKKDTVGSEIRKIDPVIQKHLNNIRLLDEQIAIATAKWKEMKLERQTVQKSLCEQLENPNNSDMKKSKLFLELCASEVDSQDDDQVPAQNNELRIEDKAKENNTTTKSSAKDFVKRNVELAKNMSFPVSLTDEEKLKLEALLANIEEVEQLDDTVEVTQNSEENISNGDMDLKKFTQTNNEYKLITDDSDRLSEIDEKIKDLSTFDIELLDINEVECQLEDDRKSGKNWKYSLLDDRLKAIDAQLFNIKKERDEEDDPSTSNSEINFLNEEIDIEIIMIEGTM